MNQLTLELSDAPPRPLPERLRAFIEFHRENPGVYDLLRRFAIEAKRSGRERMGLRALAERARWYATIEHSGEWKINNNHLPYYARLLMIAEPSLEGMFETRDGKFDATDAQIKEHCT